MTDETNGNAISRIVSLAGADLNDLHRIAGTESVEECWRKRLPWAAARERIWPEVDSGAHTLSPVLNPDIPGVLVVHIRDIAERVQCPIEYVLMTKAAIIGSLATGKRAICPRMNEDSFRINPNIFVILVGPPSAKKSPPISLAIKQLEPYAKREKELYDRRAAEKSAELKTLCIEIKGVEKKLGTATDPAGCARLRGQLQELITKRETLENSVLAYDPIFTSDSTPEAIVNLAAGSKCALMLAFDELGKLLNQMQRQEFSEIRPLLNQGYSGNDPYRSHRVSVKRNPVEALKLSLMGAIQPALLEQVMKSNDDGFMARFFLVCSELVGSSLVDRPQNKSATEKFESVLEQLYALQDELVLRYDCEAWSYYETLYKKYDRIREQSTEQSAFIEGFLGKFESHLNSLALIFALCENPGAETVNAKSLRAAEGVFDGLLSHYQKAVQIASPATKLERLLSSGILKSGMTVREVQRSGAFGREKVSIEKALRALEEEGFLKVLKIEENTRPSEIVIFNPSLTAPDEQSSQGKSCEAIVTNVAFDKGETFETQQQSQFDVRVWSPESGCLGSEVALDTETDSIVEGSVPQLRLLQACALENEVWLVCPEDVHNFIEAHLNSRWIMHNFAFDLAVLEKHLERDFSNRLENNKLGENIVDTGLLYQLTELATKGKIPLKGWSLEKVSEDLLQESLDKDSELRLSWDQSVLTRSELLKSLSHSQIDYAARDAWVTLRIWKKLESIAETLPTESLLTLPIQMQAAWTLGRVSARGISVDRNLLNKRLAELKQILEHAEAKLREFGYVKGEKGNQKVLQVEAEKAALEQGVELQKTEKTGKVQLKEEALASLTEHSDLLKWFFEFQRKQKTLDFLRKMDIAVIHPKFSPLMRTGRTSCRSPNVQNLPRCGVREVLVPRDRYTFIIADYSAIELVTLAQHCLVRYGESKLAEMINKGLDPHTELARFLKLHPVSNMPNVSIVNCPVTKEDRQKAKAINFGFPGGLGVSTFVEYAANTYGLRFSSEEAQSFKKAYLKLFPEIGRHLSGSSSPDSECVSTLSGRIAANSTYCQARNFVFQGLAADGAKRAMFLLERAGFRIVNFIHDEFVIEVPYDQIGENNLEREGEKIAELMKKGMREFTPDVAVNVDWFAADRYTKNGGLVRDESGNVIPYVVPIQGDNQ